jgi:hypothetical protein
MTRIFRNTLMPENQIQKLFYQYESKPRMSDKNMEGIALILLTRTVQELHLMC